MPKGVYERRAAAGWRRPRGNEWREEHDAKLLELLELGLSFSQLRPCMLEAFPGMTWTRNACLGRAHRKGYMSNNNKGGRPGIRRVAKPKRVKSVEGKQRKAFVKALAPVVFKKSNSVLLWHESDRGAANSPPGSKRRGIYDPVVIERKKGTLPAIIEERPLTSVPVVDCESESCMWPTSEDVTCMEVCGARVEVGAYCARHAIVAYRVFPTARRNGLHGKQDVEHTRRIDASQHRDTLDRDGEWLGRMIMEQVVTAPADEPALMIPRFLEDAS